MVTIKKPSLQQGDLTIKSGHLEKARYFLNKALALYGDPALQEKHDFSEAGEFAADSYYEFSDAEDYEQTGPLTEEQQTLEERIINEARINKPVALVIKAEGEYFAAMRGYNPKTKTIIGNYPYGDQLNSSSCDYDIALRQFAENSGFFETPEERASRKRWMKLSFERKISISLIQGKKSYIRGNKLLAKAKKNNFDGLDEKQVRDILNEFSMVLQYSRLAQNALRDARLNGISIGAIDYGPTVGQLKGYINEIIGRSTELVGRIKKPELYEPYIGTQLELLHYKPRTTPS